MQQVNRVWRLKKRPEGDIGDGDLELCNEAIPEPKDGELLVKIIYLSLDPTNRIWMSDMDQYMEPVAVGEVMRGIVCGRVIKSKHPKFREGDVVSGFGGWGDYLISDGSGVAKMMTPAGISIADAFGIFAVVGPTAYFGLLDLGQPKPGETVVVSAAAGAVGSLVGQIAKLQGCRVVGLAGSDEKCRWIKDELGFDVAINYKKQNLDSALGEACPNGIDVYFDNVGGETLDWVLKRVNLHARIPTCGLISMYNASTLVPGPYRYTQILVKRVRVEGFIVLDYAPRFAEAITALADWIRAGKLKYRLHVVDGLENAVKTVRFLFTGENNGKLLIRVSDEA